MKLKAFLMIAFCFLLGTTFGQEYKNDLTSVKTIDNQLQDEDFCWLGEDIILPLKC